MKKLFFILVLFSVAMAANCGNLVGTWIHKDEGFNDISKTESVYYSNLTEYTFNENGTYTKHEYHSIGKKITETKQTGNYLLKEPFLYLRPSDKDNYTRYRITWTLNVLGIFIESGDSDYLTLLKVKK